MASDGNSNKSERITRSERNILQLLSEGLSDREIATRLVLSLSTVKWHIKNIYTKLGVERRVQAVNRARELGLVNFPIPAAEPFRDRLPPDTTSFVDRRIDTERILETLDDPACRLLTLVGSGGIGKTRLAIHAARRISSTFRDGKVFISLVGVSSVTALAPTIANALSFSFYGAEEPETQLLRYLSNKTLLLVIDNYEQFLPDASLLIKILEHAAAIKLLVTSRERLNVREEWLFQVDGLPVTTLEKHDPTREHDAFDLFVQRASQINPNFRGIGQDAPFVVEICRQVEGIPLALELAAGWARSLTAREIAEQMSKSFKLLTTGVRNIPERHRSMRVVFEETWARLTVQEQTILEALSVFRDGFTRQAAEQVAEADLSMLGVLQDKSLIGRQVSGRYETHELLRQFAEEKLILDPDHHTRAQEHHCHYFTQLLWETRAAILDARQHETVSTLKIEIENIRKAWHWLVSREDWSALERSWETLSHIFTRTTRFQEGKALFSLVAEQLKPPYENEEHQRTIVIALTQCAMFSFELNQLSEAIKLIDKAQVLIEKSRINDLRIRIYAYHCLALLSWANGDYQTALGVGRRLLEVSSQTNQRFYQAMGHFNLGQTYLRLGDLQSARTHLQQLEDLATPLELGYAYQLHALVAEAFGDTHEAQTFLIQSLDIFRQIEHQYGIVASLIDLGRVLGHNGQRTEAATYLYEALDLAIAIEIPQHIMGTVVEIAFLFPIIHQTPRAVALLEFLQTQSTAWQQYSERISPYLAELWLLAQANSAVTEKSQPPFTTMEQVIETVQAVRGKFKR